MKKVFLSMGLLITSVSFSYSQDSLFVPTPEFKAAKGDFTTELVINPIKGELSLNNALEQIKFRYFTSSNFALRMGIVANGKKKTSDDRTPYGLSGSGSKTTRKTNLVGMTFGVEKHFAGTKRLSPYFASEITFATKWSSEKVEKGNTVTEIEGAWSEYISVSQVGPNGTYYSTSLNYAERAFTRLGINLLFGFDYYVAKNLFLGYELGLSIDDTVYNKTKIKSTGENPNGWNPITTVEQPKEEQLSIGTNLISGIRIGYAF